MESTSESQALVGAESSAVAAHVRPVVPALVANAGEQGPAALPLRFLLSRQERSFRHADLGLYAGPRPSALCRTLEELAHAFVDRGAGGFRLGDRKVIAILRGQEFAVP